MKYFTTKKVPKRFSKRFIRHTKKPAINPRKKKITKNVFSDPSPISSPYNSNEYLMRNQSSPFYEDEDEEEDFSFQQSELVDLVNGLKETKENELNCDKLDSTLDESEIINDPGEECKKKFGENCEMQKK
jgi:hypothetical protein